MQNTDLGWMSLKVASVVLLVVVPVSTMTSHQMADQAESHSHLTPENLLYTHAMTGHPGRSATPGKSETPERSDHLKDVKGENHVMTPEWKHLTLEKVVTEKILVCYHCLIHHKNRHSLRRTDGESLKIVVYIRVSVTFITLLLSVIVSGLMCLPVVVSGVG